MQIQSPANACLPATNRLHQKHVRLRRTVRPGRVQSNHPQHHPHHPENCQNSPIRPVPLAGPMTLIPAQKERGTRTPTTRQPCCLVLTPLKLSLPGLDLTSPCFTGFLSRRHSAFSLGRGPAPKLQLRFCSVLTPVRALISRRKVRTLILTCLGQYLPPIHYRRACPLPYRHVHLSRCEMHPWCSYLVQNQVVLLPASDFHCPLLSQSQSHVGVAEQARITTSPYDCQAIGPQIPSSFGRRMYSCLGGEEQNADSAPTTAFPLSLGAGRDDKTASMMHTSGASSLSARTNKLSQSPSVKLLPKYYTILLS